MTVAMFKFLQNVWLVSALFGVDHELEVSNRLVSKLDIPEYTKHSVLGIQEPETGALMYILCVNGLSERSARDVEHLIRAVRPKVVLADGDWIWYVEYWENDHGDTAVEPIPTSAFRVLRQCFMGQLSVHRYRDVARILVLEKIFGVCHYENYIVAKRTAEEVGSYFLMVPPKYVPESPIEYPPRACPLSDTQSYEAPLHALSLYPILASLSNLYSMDNTLACAQKMLDDVDTGASVNAQDLFQCQNFHVAVEDNRLALYLEGIHPYAIATEKVVKFSELSDSEMFKCLLAQGIKDQVKKFDKIVAIVAGTHFNHLRRFWNARTLPENKSAVEGLFVRYEDSGVRAPLVKTHKKGPSVLTLAGVTAVLAGSALFKTELITPVYRLMKR